MTTTSTTIGRLKVDHPDLGHDAGASLHTKIATIYQKLADNIGTRYFESDALANGASVDLEHNFKDSFSNLRVHLFSRNVGDGELTRLVSGGSPDLDDFTIVATPGNVTTQIRITNNTGSAQDISVVVFQGFFAEKMDDLADVDLVTTPPFSGDYLRYDGVNWTPTAATSSAGIAPVGSVLAYNPGYYTDSANGSFTFAGGVAGNSIADVNAFLNASGWYVCDGAALNLPASPIFNGAGRHLPNLTDDRFLQGSTTAGAIGGSSVNTHDHSYAHTHTFVHGHRTDSKLTTIDLRHSHTVNDHTHNFNHTHNAGTYSARIQRFGSTIWYENSNDFTTWTANQFVSGNSGNSGSQAGLTGGSNISGSTSHTGNTGGATPGTNLQLNDYNANHFHDMDTQTNSTTGGQSTTTTGSNSVNENRPKFLANYFIIRVV